MSTYTQILYQIVFSTKHRKPVLNPVNRPELFKYIWGVLKEKKCHLYRINGVEDHIHIVTQVHPTIALAALIKEIKVASTNYIKANNLFPDFEQWQVGYAAFTYAYSARQDIIEYVKNQEEHHKSKTYLEELIALLHEHQIVFEPRYLD